MSDLVPLPVWRQRLNAFNSWRRRSKDRRAAAWSAFASMARMGLTLAISVLGGTLISYGIWAIYRPAGFVVAGALLWVIQWNYGNEEGRG